MTTQPDSPPASSSSMTTSELMQRMFELRDESREIKAQAKELDEEYELLARVLIAKLNEQGVTRAAMDLGTAVLTKTTVPHVSDWAVVEEWIKENDALYLFNRQMKAAAYRELLQSGVEIPGTSPFEKTSISLRSAT